MEPTDVRSAARRAGDSPVVEWGARLGYAVVGLVHLVIGWIALQIAVGAGGSSASADKSGALGTLGGTATGGVLLWAAVVGFAMLALWQLTEVVVGQHDGAHRAKAAGKSLVYAFFAWSAWTFAQGSGGSDEQKTDAVTGSLMQQPAGRLLVALVGLVVLGIAAYHVHKGWARTFLEDLRDHPGGWAVHAGRWGYVAKGLALGVVGVFFVVAAWRADPNEATGLDGALKTLREQPVGPVLLGLVAIGLAAYGVYSFARSRYARI